MLLRRILKVVLTTIVAGLCLYFAFRNVNVDELWQALRGLQWQWALLAIAAMIVAQLFRAVGWSCLLKPAVQGWVPLKVTWMAYMLGQAMNVFMPARAGDIARFIYVAKRMQASKTVVFTSLYVERVIDIMMMLSLMLLTALFTPIPPLLKPWIMGLFYAFLALLGLSVFLILPRLFGERAFFKRIRRWRLRIIGRLWEWRLRGLYRDMLVAFQVLRHPLPLALGILASAGFWCILVVSCFCLSRGLDLNASWSALTVMLMLISFGGGIVPGGVGAIEIIGLLVLKNYGLPESPAIALVLCYHGIVLLEQIAIGGLVGLKIGFRA